MGLLELASRLGKLDNKDYPEEKKNSKIR